MEGKTISLWLSEATRSKLIVNAHKVHKVSERCVTEYVEFSTSERIINVEDTQQNCSFTNHSNTVYLNIGIGCLFQLPPSMSGSAGIYIPTACVQNKQLSQYPVSPAEKARDGVTNAGT